MSWKKMRKKLASKKGFTMTELLITMAILALIGVSVGVGITTAGRAYTDITASSEASVLCSTLSTELADELRFAEHVSVTPENGLTFTSRRYGPNVKVESSGGRVTIGGHQILSEGAYTGLNAAAGVTYVNGVFEVTVTASMGAKELKSSTFSVSPITAS